MAHAFSFRPGSVVLVIHAHPDDETFATAASTLAARAAGCVVRLRIFTGGEGRAAGLDPVSLVAARTRKAALLDQAVAAVGIGDWDYLTAPGRWTDTPQAPERTIADHVAVARARARGLYGYEVGSANLVGRSGPPITITAPDGAEKCRRAALDGYLPGLGSAPAHDLPTAFPRPRDSVLMRFVLDEAGWEHDNHEVVVS